MRIQPFRRPLGWSLLILPCLLATFSGAARAQQIDASPQDADVALAERKAEQAFEAFQAKRFAEAVALYIEAYQASPNADILYNIARIYDTKLGDRPLAINFYRRYIADPGAAADRIQAANERLLALREAELAMTRSAAGPAVSLAPAPVVSGDVPSREREPGWSAPEVIGVVMGTTGVIALGVGAGFGIAALRESQTMHDLCDGTVCREQRGIDAAESASDHATVSTIGFASGGVLLALGAAFYFWIGDPPTESPKQASDTGLRLGARRESHGGFALELGGSW